MYAMRGKVTRLLLMVCLMIGLAGCPLKGDNGLSLILSPSSLNFGTDEDSLVFQVHRNLTNSPVEPVVVSTSQSWIVPEACTTDSDNCLGTGLVERLLIPIRIDRTKMLLGTNEGEVIVKTGGAAPQKLTIFAEDYLFVDFLVSNRAPAVGQAISFEDASEKTNAAGDVVSRLWEFGDGTTSTATDPVHSYTTPGLYSVTLTITTANAEESIRKAAWITVGSPAAATNFEASKTSIFEGDSIMFTDLSVSPTEPILSRRWDFGDGRTSTSARPEHQYTKAGAYTVSLTITTANTAKTETKPNFIVVQRKNAPVASFSVNPTSPIALTAARFADTSEPGSAPIDQWFWDFGDGVTSREANPTHSYTDGGQYNITMAVVSAHGSSTATDVLTVRTIPPVADFTISDSTPFVNDTVTFTNTSTLGSGPLTQYVWEFGDGGSSILKSPTYKYTAAGVFGVKLTVVTAHGQSSVTKSVTASFLPPTASFTATPRVVGVGESVQFTDTSTPGTAAVDTWLWEFGDPTSGGSNTSTLQNPIHTFNTEGYFTITLTVMTPVASDNSSTITRNAYIRAIESPTPSFTSEVVNPNEPDVIRFVNTTVVGSEPISSTKWDFDDPDSGNNSSTVANPSHRFSTERIFNVKLTVSTANRVVSVTQMVMVVFLPPTVDFTVKSINGTSDRDTILTEGALTTENLQFNSMVTLGTEMDTTTFAHAWDFGDTTSSTAETPTHTYAANGTYTVTYTLTTPTDVVTVSHDIDVDSPPIPDFTANMTTVLTNATIQFTDASDTSNSGPIVSRLWNFGDGSVSTEVNPTKSYAAQGQYTVSLTLTFDHAITGTRLTITESKGDFIQASL